MEALRRVGFGKNDYLVGFEGKPEGAKLAVIECDICGELKKTLAQGEREWAAALEITAGDHVRRMAVVEGQRHIVRIKFL